jgi:hypothetical protein
MSMWRYITIAGITAGTCAAAHASTTPVPVFGFVESAGTAALPAASAIGLGLLIGGVTVAGLIFLWRNRR